MNSNMDESEHKVIYTIGHSNHSLEHFIELLRKHDIQVVADVRSAPYSRYCPHFNKKRICASLTAVGIEYIFLGDALGARPKDANCYENGQVSFVKLAKRAEFQIGIKQLIVAATDKSLVLMCAEKRPLQCHRTILVGRELKKHNVRLRHILDDGSVEEHGDTEKRLLEMLKLGILAAGNDALDLAYDQQAAKIAYKQN